MCYGFAKDFSFCAKVVNEKREKRESETFQETVLVDLLEKVNGECANQAWYKVFDDLETGNSL